MLLKASHQFRSISRHHAQGGVLSSVDSIHYYEHHLLERQHALGILSSVDRQYALRILSSVDSFLGYYLQQTVYIRDTIFRQTVLIRDTTCIWRQTVYIRDTIFSRQYVLGILSSVDSIHQGYYFQIDGINQGYYMYLAVDSIYQGYYLQQTVCIRDIILSRQYTLGILSSVDSIR